jgi:hypothetical protein
MTRKWLLAAIVLLVSLLVPPLHAGSCLECNGPTSCIGKATPGDCCCKVTYDQGSGNFTCTSWCDYCHGLGLPDTDCWYNCFGCVSGNRQIDGKRVAMADASATSVDTGFEFTAPAYERLYKTAPLVAMVLRNLSSDCKANREFVHTFSVKDARFKGQAKVETSGFSYEGKYRGKITASGRSAQLEIALGVTTGGNKVRTVRAEVTPDGSLLAYDDVLR